MRFPPASRDPADPATGSSASGDDLLIDARSLDCTCDEALAALWDDLQRAIGPGIRSIEVHLEGSGGGDTRVLAVLVAAAGQARLSRTDLTIVVPARLRDFARVCRLDGILALRVERTGQPGQRGNPAVTPPPGRPRRLMRRGVS